MKINYTVVSSIVPVFVLLGCSESYAPASAGAAASPTPAAVAPAMPTPDETVQEMLALAEAGDWVAYVDQFYGEQHKFRPGQNDLQKVADKLASQAEAVIAGLQRVAEIQPVLEEDGRRAVYDLGEGQRFTLYRTEEGHWTFHL